MSTPITAVLSADWHLSHKPPAARAETDWYAVMANYIGQVRSLCGIYKCPLVIAGDLFDRPDNPAELVNFVMKELGSFDHKIYAVPGQHDLFHHDLKDIKRTSYWTLVESNTIINLEPNVPHYDSCGTWLHGFPWGTPLKPLTVRNKLGRNMGTRLAVVHKYVWTTSTGGHPGAKNEDRSSYFIQSLKGFDAIVVGDNHQSWSISVPGYPRTLNPGSFIRRKADEIDHRPRVGILLDDGTIKENFLDTSKDRFRPAEEVVSTESGLDPEEFLKTLRELGDVTLNFKETVRYFLRQNRVSPKVRKAVLDCLEGGK
jgi:DNA repair exonuclease SbcCD nuclease subunit